MQAEELRHHQEQEKAFGASELQKVLPVLQQAHQPQGDQINRPAAFTQDEWRSDSHRF
jgi:hypothetical protein